LLFAPSGFAATPRAVDAEIVDGEAAVYILFDDGFVQTAGRAVNLGSAPGTDAVDLTLTPSRKGYYILDEDGNVYSYGDALIVSNPLGDRSGSMVDMELAGEGKNRYYLRDNGEIVPSLGATFYGNLIKEGAVDLELTPDRQGYYVLYDDGTIAFFGSALDNGFTVSSSIQAVDLEITEAGYYVTYEDGSVLQFGGVIPLPYTPSPDANVTDMIPTGNGYRLLTADGKLKSFRQMNNQGRISWYAKVVQRAVAPRATATPMPTPTPTPRPSDEYFLMEKSGFTEKIVGTLPENIVIPENLTTGQASTFGGGVFIVVSEGNEEGDEQLARTIQLFSLDDSANEKTTGEAFATLNPKRGAAEIRGLSYSLAGLYVTIKDDSGYLIFLLEGNFEEADVTTYMLH